MQDGSRIVGIYDREVYISENGVNGDFTVIKPVDVDTLHFLHTVDGLIESGWDEIWKRMVANGETTMGLKEWLAYQISMFDDGEEIFVGKNDETAIMLTRAERSMLDEAMMETYGLEVGTWVDAGYHEPRSIGKFEDWDRVIDRTLAERYKNIFSFG